jgi:stress response protein YsnF
MTTIRQLIQTSPTKANELFAVLADTSNNAVKTRERILGDLKSELELLAKLEEEHLFPVLRKHKETKDLVTAALNDNKQTRKLLAELEQTPKGSEEFAPKVAELRKVFQQSVRDERKDLLPAVLKALSDEEAQAIVEKIEDGKAEVEGAKRAEAEQRRAEQKQERERLEQILAEEKEAADRERKTREAAQKAAEQAAQTAQIAVESTNQVAQSAAETVQRVAAAPLSTGSLFFDAMFGMWGLPSGRSVARSSNASASRTQPSIQEEEVIPLAEETLIVGKRAVNSGTTTVRRYVVEVPTEQQVTLYDEKVVVERRKPVTDAATGETLTELNVEMIETSEVPLVAKGVRVREEVVVRRERTKRVETVRDTIRRDEVEISNASGRSGNKRAALAHSRK